MSQISGNISENSRRTGNTNKTLGSVQKGTKLLAQKNSPKELKDEEEEVDMSDQLVVKQISNYQQMKKKNCIYFI